MSNLLLFALFASNLAADHKLLSPAAPYNFYFSADGKSVISKCRDNHLRTWDTATGKLLSDTPRPASSTLISADLLLDGEPKSNSMTLWDLSSQRQLQILSGEPTHSATVSQDRRFIATANPDERSIRLWDLKTGKQNHNLPDGLGSPSQLVFSPDGETVVSANYDNDVRVWKTKSGELVRKVEDLTGAMFAAGFTPDGKQLIMAGLDETVYIWDAKSFKLTRTLKGHGETIASLAISPDGRTLVTGGFDVITTKNPVKLAIWDLASGKITKSIRAPHRVSALAFSPDGKWLAFSTGENEISLLNLDSAR